MRFTNLGLGGRGELKADINVTPLVAVLLVVVFVLMLSTPHVDGGFYVQLPRAAHTVDKPNPRMYDVTVVELTVVTLSDASRRLVVSVNGWPIREENLAAKVAKSLESKKDKTVLFRGDKDVPYSDIMAAMNRLQKAQIENISLMVEEAR